MIEILRAGQYSTIQDLGRFGFRKLGVPVSGPMDSSSARFANQLLGNNMNAPLLEMAFTGARFRFDSPAVIAIAGADANIQVGNERFQSNQIIPIEANSSLDIGQILNGNFLYLSILGGFVADKKLGSTCLYEPITGYARLNKGQFLYFNPSIQTNANRGAIVKRQAIKTTKHIEVLNGPEYHLLSTSEKKMFTETDFSISPVSNRMGFQLTESLPIHLDEIISSPVQPGTVQLTSGGQLIVLMRDAQTTGGYPRIFQLTENSINQLSQTKIGDTFRFKLT